MKNIERAKNYQKKLFAATGREWEERFFKKYWDVDILGYEWDDLYDRGLLENDFCAWCGNDELKTGYHRIKSFSARNVCVYICDDCFFEATGGNVDVKYNSPRKGCFIATAVYGYKEHPDIITLQNYRDSVISKSLLGQFFIKFYYLVSPSVAYLISRSKFLKYFIKKILIKPVLFYANKKLLSHD